MKGASHVYIFKTHTDAEKGVISRSVCTTLLISGRDPSFFLGGRFSDEEDAYKVHVICFCWIYGSVSDHLEYDGEHGAWNRSFYIQRRCLL